MSRRRTALPPPYLKAVEVDRARLAGLSGYPFDLPLVRSLELRFERVVTIVVGDNGSGKSTLLEAIAELAGFPPAGGTRSHGAASSGDDARLEAELDRDDPTGASAGQLRSMREDRRLTSVLRAGWLPKVTDGFFFRAETFFGLARYLDESALYGAGGPPLHLRRSHAEGFLDFFRARLSRTISGRRPSLFVFDEPESALSPNRQLDFVRWIRRVEASGTGQVILATHSPVLMAYPDADLWRIAGGEIAPVTLEEVDHFRLWQAFVADPRGFVARGLAVPDEPQGEE